MIAYRKVIEDIDGDEIQIESYDSGISAGHVCVTVERGDGRQATVELNQKQAKKLLRHLDWAIYAAKKGER